MSKNSYMINEKTLRDGSKIYITTDNLGFVCNINSTMEQSVLVLDSIKRNLANGSVPAATLKKNTQSRQVSKK